MPAHEVLAEQAVEAPSFVGHHVRELEHRHSGRAQRVTGNLERRVRGGGEADADALPRADTPLRHITERKMQAIRALAADDGGRARSGVEYEELRSGSVHLDGDPGLVAGDVERDFVEGARLVAQQGLSPGR